MYIDRGFAKILFTLNNSDEIEKQMICSALHLLHDYV